MNTQKKCYRLIIMEKNNHNPFDIVLKILLTFLKSKYRRWWWRDDRNNDFPPADLYINKQKIIKKRIIFMNAIELVNYRWRFCWLQHSLSTDKMQCQCGFIGTRSFNEWHNMAYRWKNIYFLKKWKRKKLIKSLKHFSWFSLAITTKWCGNSVISNDTWFTNEFRIGNGYE